MNGHRNGFVNLSTPRPNPSTALWTRGRGSPSALRAVARVNRRAMIFSVTLGIGLLSFGLVSGIPLFADQRGHPMDIVLVPVGEVDAATLSMLKDDLREVLQKVICVGKGLAEPRYAFNSKRDQFLSTAILKVLMEQKELLRYERVLGIVDHDLYVPELNFVFGLASSRGAVISLTRLRETYYGRPGDLSLFRRRMLTEAVHELGHTYGLGHCRNASCVMFFSNRLTDTDRKGPKFCLDCKKRYHALQRSR
jgi:archaemetzincin